MYCRQRPSRHVPLPRALLPPPATEPAKRKETSPLLSRGRAGRRNFAGSPHGARHTAPRLSVELDELLIGAIVDSAAAESTDRPYGAVVRIVALVPRADPLRVSEYHYR